MSDNFQELDFNYLVRALIQRWWLILALGILAGIAAFALSRLQTPKFVSEATILFTRTRRELALATQFPTVSDPVDTRARMDALLTIAGSSDTAARTFDQAKNRFPDLIKSRQDLERIVEITAIGDAIEISAQAEDPELAAFVANTWAAEAARAINSAFFGNLPQGELDKQLMLAQQDYNVAQEGLEAFLQTNQIGLLNSLIAESQFLLDRLTGERTSLVEFYDERRQLMERIISEGEALRDQIASGTDSDSGSLGDSLAVLYARLGALGFTRSSERTLTEESETVSDPRLVGPDLVLQLNDVASISDSPAELAQDVEALIRVATAEKERAELATEDLSESIVDGTEASTMEIVAAHLSELNARLEAETARELELTSERDLKWSAYQALAQKDLELRTASDTGERVVIASQAIPPENPSSSSVAVKTGLAVFLGMTLAAVGILIANWWRTSNQESVSA